VAATFTPQVVITLAVLVAVVILGVFGVIEQQTTAGVLVAILGGFGLGHSQGKNGAPAP
jgi:ABC-type bacteriocin/lantibiotic exporter with double-glycine peptidase domain